MSDSNGVLRTQWPTLDIILGMQQRTLPPEGTDLMSWKSPWLLCLQPTSWPATWEEVYRGTDGPQCGIPTHSLPSSSCGCQAL